MPTRYTADIEKGISFEQFVWHCARAFGALVMMRDDPMDAPIPMEFKPESHYSEWLAEAEKRLTKLESMTVDEADWEASAAYQKAVANNEIYRATKAAQERSYRAMLDRVMAWKPPTADHQGLKDFMVQQITDSIKFDCHDYAEPEIRLTGSAWIKQERTRALDSVARYQKHVDDEIERCRGRTEWVRALCRSVGSPPIKEPK